MAEAWASSTLVPTGPDTTRSSPATAVRVAHAAGTETVKPAAETWRAGACMAATATMSKVALKAAWADTEPIRPRRQYTTEKAMPMIR